VDEYNKCIFLQVVFPVSAPVEVTSVDEDDPGGSAGASTGSVQRWTYLRYTQIYYIFNTSTAGRTSGTHKYTIYLIHQQLDIPQVHTNILYI
jgi:hypothetical protein